MSSEAQLLRRVNQRLPAEIQLRYDELIAKREAKVLTSAEQNELLRETNVAEEFDVARVQALTELAAARGVSVAELMNDRQAGIDV